MSNNPKVKDAEVLDAVLGEFGKFEYMLINHWKKLIAACVLIVLVICGFFVVREIRNNSAQEAASTLSAAVTVEELEKSLATYGDSPIAREAHLRLAQLYVGKQDYTKAIAQFDKVIKSNPPAEMLNRLRLDTCYLYENAKDLTKASALFSTISKNPSLSSGMRAEAAFGAGRLFVELKDNAKAIEAFSLASDLSANVDPANQLWCSMAKEKLSTLAK